MGIVTHPEAQTRVGAAGVGGEKRGRDREGTAESNVGRVGGGGRGGSGRRSGGWGWDWAWRGTGRGACTGRGAGRGTVKEVWGVTKGRVVSTCGNG